MANEAKQFTIGGVTHDVMDVGARQLITQLQAAIDAITSGDTTTAIKTFQEVIDFLDGVTDDATLIGKLNELRTLIAAKYSKPASGIPASDLADGVIPDVSGFATKTEVNAKANDNAVVKSISVNGTAQAKDGNGNVNIEVEGGGLSKEDISVETQGDGTVDINVADDTYTINLNHTHEGMAKLVKCTEATLPQTMADDIIYVQVDSLTTPTEIESLYLFGLEFTAAADTTPKLISPIGGSTIDLGTNTGNGVSKPITVKGKNLTQDLTLQLKNATGFSFDSTQATGVTVISSTEVTVDYDAATNTGVAVVIKYTGINSAATGTLNISNTSEINVSCGLTASYEQPDMIYTEQEARAAFEDSTLANKWINANGSTIGSPPVYINNTSQRTVYILKIPLSGVAVLKYPMFKSSEGLGSVICDADGNVVWKFSNSSVKSGSMNTVDVSNITDASYALIQLADSVTGYTIETSSDLYYGITDDKANTAAAIVDATGYCLSNVYVIFTNHNYKVYTGFTQSPDTNNKYGFRCYAEDGTTYATMYSVDSNVDQNGVMNFVVSSTTATRCGVATFKMSEIDDCYIYDVTDGIYLFRGKNVTTNNNNN